MEKNKVERKKITLTCERNGQPVPVEITAYICGGLAIHKAITTEKLYRSSYTLTHLLSSQSVATGLRWPVAILCEALQDIESQMDWSKPYAEIVSIWVHNETVKKAVLSRIRRLHG